MKNVILVLLIFIVSGCSAGLQQWQSMYVTTGLNFAKYSANGFLLTPEGYNDPYESIGIIEILFIPEVRRYTGGPSQPVTAGSHIINTGGSRYYYVEADSDQILERMYQTAREMGADAIIRLNIESLTIDNNGFPINSVRGTGFAIKRN